jgi:hypothetical protein
MRALGVVVISPSADFFLRVAEGSKPMRVQFIRSLPLELSTNAF